MLDGLSQYDLLSQYIDMCTCITGTSNIQLPKYTSDKLREVQRKYLVNIHEVLGSIAQKAVTSTTSTT